jgi:hypothetical protein
MENTYLEISIHCVLVSFFLKFIIILLEKRGFISWFESKFTDNGICYFCLLFWMSVLYVLICLFVDFTVFHHIDYTYFAVVFISPVLATDLLKW